MTKIKECIIKGTDKEPKILYEYDEDSNVFTPAFRVEGKGLIRNITIDMSNLYRAAMEIVLIPFTKKAIIRNVWMENPDRTSRYYFVKDEYRPSTLDDIEDWIKKHFQKG